MKKKILALVLAAVIALSLAGCGHEHVFKEADCTTPKTCEKCGTTEGESLGHTVKAGRCERCGKLVNEEIITKICQLSLDASAIGNDIVKSVTSVDASSPSALYNMIKSKEVNFPQMREKLKKIVALCADYEELKTVKTATQDLIKMIPNPVKSSNPADLVNTLQEYIDFAQEEMRNAKVMANFAKDLKGKAQTESGTKAQNQNNPAQNETKP